MFLKKCCPLQVCRSSFFLLESYFPPCTCRKLVFSAIKYNTVNNFHINMDKKCMYRGINILMNIYIVCILLTCLAAFIMTAAFCIQ